MTTTPTVGILGTIRQLLMAVVQLLVVFTAAMLFALSAPLLYTVGVEWLIWKNPHDLTFGVPYFLLGPFVCSIWMLVIVHFHSIRQWTREGRLATWKQDHGGFWKTNMKATRFLFMGFFGSAFAETVFFLAGLKVFPNGIVGDRASAMLYFALAPFAVFAPCWICLVWRSIRGDEKERYDPLATDELYTSPQLEAEIRDLAKRQAAEREARGDDKFLKSVGVAGSDYNPFDYPDAYADDDPNISLACWHAKRQRAARLRTA